MPLEGRAIACEICLYRLSTHEIPFLKKIIVVDKTKAGKRRVTLLNETPLYFLDARRAMGSLEFLFTLETRQIP